MIRDILRICELTVREARRKKILWAALGLGVAYVVLYSIGFYFIHRDFVLYDERPGSQLALNTGFNFIVMAGMYVISFLGVVLAVLTSVGTLAGEIDSNTIQCIAAKPIPRGSIVLGKWLGLAGMISIYVLLMGGGVLLTTWLIAGYSLPNGFVGLLLIAFQAIIMLTVCVYGGTKLSAIANGVVAFMLYGLAFIGGWIEQIGSAMQNETAVDIGILSSLVVPSEAVWKKAAYLMQPPAIRSLPVSPFGMASAPSTAMIIYAGLYVVVLLLLALRSFWQRDL